MWKSFCRFCKCNQLTACSIRSFCINDNANLPKISKSDRISAAIQLYISKCSEFEKLLEKEKVEYEFGRKYLAKMMGANPDNFNHEDVNASIRYLFPSMLSEKAKPIMAEPSNLYPRKKSLQCDALGRPLHSFYYTSKPTYYGLTNEAAYVLEKLKALEDDKVRKENVQEGKLNLKHSQWLSKEDLENFCTERLTEYEYTDWLTLMTAIYNHPFSSHAAEFVKKMRKNIHNEISFDDIPKPMKDPLTGRMYAESYGQKKWTVAEVRLYMPGSGHLTIDDQCLIDKVPMLGDREAILFPLQFTDTIDKVDIVATSKTTGSSCLAYALRLAISRALTCFMQPEIVKRMRLAGLLTQDDRFREKKQAGQPKARKKAPWRPR